MTGTHGTEIPAIQRRYLPDTQPLRERDHGNVHGVEFRAEQAWCLSLRLTPATSGPVSSSVTVTLSD